MKIVQFKDGKYGIRKLVIPLYRYEFLNLSMVRGGCPTIYWHTLDSSCIGSCKSENLEHVRMVFKELPKTIKIYKSRVKPDNGEVIR